MASVAALLRIHSLKWGQSPEGLVAAESELGALVEAQPMDLARLPGDALRLDIVCKEGAG
jgi:hypothetical protein